MNKLSHIIYVSSTKNVLSEKALSNLLESFKSNNLKHGITGMLLYHDGNIMQLIEGPQDKIDQLYRNITADERHCGIITLIKEEISTREFGDWSMSYKNISGIEPDGFSDFIKVGSFPDVEAPIVGKAKKLLLSFRG